MLTKLDKYTWLQSKYDLFSTFLSREASIFAFLFASPNVDDIAVWALEGSTDLLCYLNPLEVVEYC